MKDVVDSLFAYEHSPGDQAALAERVAAALQALEAGGALRCKPVGGWVGPWVVMVCLCLYVFWVGVGGLAGGRVCGGGRNCGCRCPLECAGVYVGVLEVVEAGAGK